MVRNKKGFTLIELLIVVVIIGILAAIAIPKFSNTKEKAYLAAMKADLRNLATYEESFAADSAGTYFAGTATSASPVQGFRPSQKVTVTASLATTSSGAASWSAVAAHASTGRTCNTSADGIIACT